MGIRRTTGYSQIVVGEDKDFRIFENVIILVAFMFVVLGAEGYQYTDPLNSRLATVYSLTKYGTWYIDRPPEEDPIPYEQRTIDKIVVNDRLLSSKPPVLPLLMTAECVVMNKLFGWDLDYVQDTNKLSRVMNMTLVGFSYVAALYFFSRLLRLFVPDPLTRGLLLFSLAFCTQFWGYSTHMNNHIPCAAMIVIALYFGLGLAMGRLGTRPWRFVAFGFCAGLVPTLDMPGTIFVLPVGLYLLFRRPKMTLMYATLGAALPLLVHCGIMYHVTGDIRPVQMREELYLYEGSYWRNPRGIDALNEPRLVYLFHMLVGRCGLFSLYPILLCGMAGTIRALVRKRVLYRGHILCGAAAFITLTAYYLVKTYNYGGEAYGFRWYIVAMPILLLMGVPVFMDMRVRWKWYFVGLMIGVSFFSATECMRNPWGSNHEWTSRLFLGTSYGHIEKPHREPVVKNKVTKALSEPTCLSRPSRELAIGSGPYRR